MEREYSYIVLKLTDTNAALNDDERAQLDRLVTKVAIYRCDRGKP